MQGVLTVKKGDVQKQEKLNWALKRQWARGLKVTGYGPSDWSDGLDSFWKQGSIGHRIEVGIIKEAGVHGKTCTHTHTSRLTYYILVVGRIAIHFFEPFSLFTQVGLPSLSVYSRLSPIPSSSCFFLIPIPSSSCFLFYDFRIKKKSSNSLYSSKSKGQNKLYLCDFSFMGRFRWDWYDHCFVLDLKASLLWADLILNGWCRSWLLAGSVVRTCACAAATCSVCETVCCRYGDADLNSMMVSTDSWTVDSNGFERRLRRRRSECRWCYSDCAFGLCCACLNLLVPVWKLLIAGFEIDLGVNWCNGFFLW